MFSSSLDMFSSSFTLFSSSLILFSATAIMMVTTSALFSIYMSLFLAHASSFFAKIKPLCHLGCHPFSLPLLPLLFSKTSSNLLGQLFVRSARAPTSCSFPVPKVLKVLGVDNCRLDWSFNSNQQCIRTKLFFHIFKYKMKDRVGLENIHYRKFAYPA